MVQRGSRGCAIKIGLIVEGGRDHLILSSLAQRIAAPIEFAPPLVYRGKKNLRTRLAGFLKAFQFEVQQGTLPVLHRDSNGQEPALVEQELRTFCPPEVSLVIPVQETEAWLFADPSLMKKHFAGCAPPGAMPETIATPKEERRRVASQARVALTEDRLGSLLAELDLGLLEQRCPSFRKFADLLRSL